MRLDDLVTFTDTPDLMDRPDRVVVTIPKQVTTLAELYDFYGEVLGRERYFGRNSAAFVDCLTNPERHATSWQEIVVWHPSLPHMGKRAVRRYFGDLLFALRRVHKIRGRSPSFPLRIRVVFRAGTRQQLVRWSQSELRWLGIDH